MTGAALAEYVDCPPGNWKAARGTAARRDNCHELGHPERVRILADKIQKTYR